MQIETEIKGAIEGYIGSDKFKEHISNQAEKMVNEAVSNCFRSYGDISKNIETAVKEALAFDVKDLGLTGYGKFLSEIVADTLKKAMIDEKVQEKVNKRIADITRVAPKEIVLDDLKRAILKEVTSNSCSCEEIDLDELLECNTISDYCTFEVEANDQYDWITLYIDERPSKLERNCEYEITCYKSGRMHIKMSGREASMKELAFDFHHGFRDYLYSLFLADTKIDYQSVADYL